MRSSRDLLAAFALATGLTPFQATAEIENLFNSNTVTIQQGDGFEVGESRRRILTLEHASAWNWGDIFAFYDNVEERNGGDSSYYFEVSPRFSLAGFGLDGMPQPIQDVLIATTLERGSNGFEANLIGPGLTWDLPPFTHLETNLYYRDNPDRAGSTWQFTAAWALPFELGGLDLLFNGFVDIRGSEGGLARDLNFNPQLKLDLGELAGYPGVFYGGVEYYHWNSKFGIDGVDERVLSPLLQVCFSF